MNPFDILDSKLVQEVATMIHPGVGFALGTLSKLDDTVSKAKGGDVVAIRTIKEIKMRSDMGDAKANQVVKTMSAISRKQNEKKKGFYSRGISVGHDPYSIGQVTDHRGGTTTTYYRPPTSGTSPYTRFFTNTTSVPPPGARPGSTTPLGMGTGTRRPVSTPTPTPPAPTTPVDPYASQYPGQGYPSYPPYPGQGYPNYPPMGYDPYSPYSMMGYGTLPGLPAGYGYYEEPIINQGGFQQYDPATDSFYSSNQKQVYDEETGMFFPAPQSNPYAF